MTAFTACRCIVSDYIIIIYAVVQSNLFELMLVFLG